MGLVASLVSGVVNGNRASDLQAQATRRHVQQQVETARYTCSGRRTGRTSPPGAARRRRPAARRPATTSRSTAAARRASSGSSPSTRASSTRKGRESLAAIETNWRAMSDYNDQIFELWAAGRLDEGDAMSTGEKWDVFYVLDQAMTELVKSVDARAAALRAGGRRPTTHRTDRRPGHRAGGPRPARSPSRAASSAGSREVQAGLQRVAEATCPSACPCAAATSSVRWPPR